jgi:hypothetical protein
MLWYLDLVADLTNFLVLREGTYRRCDFSSRRCLLSYVASIQFYALLETLDDAAVP